MSLVVVTVLLFAALIFVTFRKRKFVLCILSITLLLIFAIGSGFIPELLIRNLQVYPHSHDPQWREDNAIILLGFGVVKWPPGNQVSVPPIGASRIQETVRLYYGCKKQSSKCKVIVSGGDTGKFGVPEAQLMAEMLKSIGVSPDDIILETQSLNTFQNAEFVTKILNQHQFNRVVVVTSGLHMRRTLLYFSHFSIVLVPTPSDYWSVNRSVWPLSYNFAIMDIALHEYIGLIRYQIYNLMGWNSKPVENKKI